MNAVTKVREQETLPGVPAEPLDMLTMIYRATKDPEIDAGKMMQLMEMAERFEARQAQQAFNVAMISAQEEMDPVRTDANNPQTRSRYATWAALDRAIRPIYSKHGFALSFDTGEGAPADYVRVLLYVMHKSGHTKTYHMDMPADGKGAKGNDVMTKTHATGSAFAYGKRYVGGGAFNIIVSDAADDDGNGAGGHGPIADEQRQTLEDLIEKSHSDIEKFVKYMGVEALKDISVGQYGKALEALNLALDAWQRKQSKGGAK